MEDMKVIILQTDISWANPKANVQKVDEMLARCGEADLFVLPEMFSTGFCTRPEGIAEPVGSDTLLWMKQKAAELNAALAGSIAVEENGHFYNRFYFVHPDGQVQWYDKKHLFTYGGEHKSFTAGAERVIVNFRGVRILLQVCWNILLRARAIENQCYVVAVNRVGEDPACQYCGGSAVIDPYGHTLAACEDNKSCTAEATIDMDVLEAFRKKFPVLDDADPYQIL